MMMMMNSDCSFSLGTNHHVYFWWNRDYEPRRSSALLVVTCFSWVLIGRFALVLDCDWSIYSHSELRLEGLCPVVCDYIEQKIGLLKMGRRENVARIIFLLSSTKNRKIDAKYRRIVLKNGTALYQTMNSHLIRALFLRTWAYKFVHCLWARCF